MPSLLLNRSGRHGRIRALIRQEPSPPIEPRAEFNRLYTQGSYETAAAFVPQLTELDLPVKIADHLNDEPLLFSAVIDEAHPVVEKLLECGANPNIVGYRRQTPLHMAANHRSLDLLALLVKHGGNLRQEAVDGVAPWQYAETDKVLEQFPELKKDYERLQKNW